MISMISSEAAYYHVCTLALLERKNHFWPKNNNDTVDVKLPFPEQGTDSVKTCSTRNLPVPLGLIGRFITRQSLHINTKKFTER